jgi:hypothetical protein
MMISLRLRRAFALLASAILLLSGAGEAAGVHPCPHHSGIAAPAAAAGDHHHHRGAHDRSAPADHDHAPCNCGGHCAPPLGLVLPPVAIIPVPSAVVDAARALRTGAEARPARHIPHLLPFAQAPPRAG